MRKLALFIGKTGGARTHPEIITYTCTQKCQPIITTRKDSPNLGDIKHCEKSNCDLKLNKIGHTSTGISEKLRKNLSSEGCCIKDLKGGFGKNSDLPSMAAVLHSTPSPTDLEKVRYVDIEGTEVINKTENYEILTNNINNE